MFDYHISFHSPWYLLLLLLIPPVWVMSLKGLSALGRVRRWIVLALRTAVMLLLILALAEVQWVRTSERLTVVYLLDQSLSIPPEQRRAMIEYVNASIIEHRQKDDRAGVIVFGRDAAIEIPPFDDSVQIPPVIESILDPENTNLSGAMRLAQASFPEDAAKRIVIVSDGNENLGDALKQAQAVSGSGIGIDVVPIRYESRSEVSVQRLTIPSDVRRGQPFDMKVVVNNSSKPRAGAAGEISGRIVLSQLVGDRTQVLSDEKVVLPPGKRVLTLRQQIDSPAFYKYQVRFVPDNPDDDGMQQNNRATTFTHVRGRGQVLLIEDHEQPGQFNLLAERLRKQNLEVTVQPTDRLFADMAALQPYDTVILGDVGRERFTGAQIEMLVRNTQQMGSGLVMLGGPNSFGVGGWTNSKLEEAMPVEFQIKSAKVIPRGALAMLMHASEMARGNHWQKVIGREALKTLGPRDYCGVIHWSGRDQWLWRGGMVEVGQNRKKMIALIDRMTPGDMPQFDPAMKMAAKGFARLPDAAIKHMIIISDGDPSPPSAGAINNLKKLKVTVTTVAVGTHGA
ncbi:MAG: VWA domain-containing protein, partial [Planctomycetota bacterium]|nr:VWA domain-containing protein [Planctomycetota bacterium]